MQIVMSPFYGKVDLSPVTAPGADRGPLDRVSVADVLRNGFVYPPHSIYEDVKLVTFGFSQDEDMCGSPRFRFKFRDAGKSPAPSGAREYWVQGWHERLVAAIRRATDEIRRPWLLQSGGKDSTAMAIGVAEARPDTTCLTYLGGHEENEVDSARHVAHKLGLRHEALVCDPGRAYDRYLGIVDRMPLLTGDFALLSYVDLATEVAGHGGDGVIDGLGTDSYFGNPENRQKRILSMLARGWRLPRWVMELPLVERSFALCFMLGTVQMNRDERIFPGSRFTDAEVDELFGAPMAARSRARLEVFRDEIESSVNPDERRDIIMSIAGSTGAFAKGLFTASALSLRMAYPFCDPELREWVYSEVPRSHLVDPVTKENKALMRAYIASRFGKLPYVERKGSFRFDLRGLARARYEQVHAQARQARDILPGAQAWLERNRRRLDNKYFASKFYLLAVLLPWFLVRRDGARQEAAPAAATEPELARA